jgi:hypothetical protein
MIEEFRREFKRERKKMRIKGEDISELAYETLEEYALKLQNKLELEHFTSCGYAKEEIFFLRNNNKKQKLFKFSDKELAIYRGRLIKNVTK